MKLYSKEFLESLQNQMSKVRILDYLMSAQLKTFEQAIEEMSEFAKLKPEEMNKYSSEFLYGVQKILQLYKGNTLEEKTHNREALLTALEDLFREIQRPRPQN